MPIFMDRHDIPKEIKAEHVAQMHQEDLKVEHLYNCKGMTYWCDEERNTAFCLIEAPNREAIQKMHDHAHGAFPHDIIEVDEKLVASFLGRIEDPNGSVDSELLVDSAFRVLMVIETNNYLNRIEANQLGVFTQKFHKSALKTINKFNGSVVKQDNCSYLVSFTSISNAVSCALKIQSNINYVTPKFDGSNRLLNISICAGDPVTNKETIFEEVISLATRMCEVVEGKIVISSQVKNLFIIENKNSELDKKLIRTLNPGEEKFLTHLMDYTEKIWNKSSFNVGDFSSELGYSKSQLYRKLVNLTGKSPNIFLREFKLQKALNLLFKQKGNISEVAYETGFNSPAYFTKCFLNKYGILPSKYIQQHIS